MDNPVRVTRGKGGARTSECVCVCVRGEAENGFAYSRTPPTPHPRPLHFTCHQQGGSLIMFSVVFTNVSFIKHQQPQQRPHPSAKVEVIITLNHPTAHLFGCLSQAEGGRPPVSPQGRDAVTLAPSVSPSAIFILSPHPSFSLLHFSLYFFILPLPCFFLLKNSPFMPLILISRRSVSFLPSF